MVDSNTEKYIKVIFKYKDWKEKSKDGKVWEIITDEKNIKLYIMLVEKMNTSILKKKKQNKYSELIDNQSVEKFKKLDIDTQIIVISQVLNLLTNKVQPKLDRKLIGVTASRGNCNSIISNLNQFSIIEQSVTGFYEKEITIIGDKGNDRENNNS